MILFLTPFFSGRVLNNIILMWQNGSNNGNIIENIVYTLRNFWTNGFGVSTDNFVNIYNSTAQHYGEGGTLINIPNLHISAVYFNILIDVGAVFMIGFMYYILRIAHSSITCMFRATPRQKIIFAAGLAALLGISISSLLDSNNVLGYAGAPSLRKNYKTWGIRLKTDKISNYVLTKQVIFIIIKHT